MKRKITKRYMIVFSVSVLLIIVLWVGLSYVAIFTDNNVDYGSPQYLVSTFGKYINKDELTIADEGKRILKENKLWAQVIDNRGTVIDSFDAPQVAQNQYNVFDLSYYVLYSDAMEGQTIYLSKFKKDENYGVVLGCDSTKIAKYNIQIFGGIREQLYISGLILIIVFIWVGFLAGFIFSRNISSPVQDIIADINRLEADITLEPRVYKKNLFSTVYDSLNKLQERLKSADRERANVERQKNKWINNISHDMRTPLSSIKGYAELLAEESYEITTEERIQFSDIIIKNSENIDNLIQELKFNRLSEDGRLELNKEEVNINKLIKECCEELPTKYTDKKITCKFGCRVLYAEADRQMLKRCFTNLIGNAFVHNKGEVHVCIESYKEKDNIVVKISDDGRGMSKEETDKIFERYYRGVDSKTEAGSGLGLAIVKEIVEAHGGVIEVQSEEGKGTIFIIKV